MFGRRKRKEKTQESSQKTGSAWKRAFGGIFGRGGIDSDFWEELEEALIISDVGPRTAMEMVEQLQEQADENGWKDPEQVRAALHDRIVKTFAELAEPDPLPAGAPIVLLVVGVNGVGKTTSIAKIAQAALSEGRSVLMAAGDTFRAGAIEQLKIWGNRLDVPVIAQNEGGDPGAVVFDAMASAKARGRDLVIVDTAGRLQTKHNLMQELKKVRGIIDREGAGFTVKVLLVIDSNTGQNGLAQAKAFTEAVSCDGVMLTKLDSTAKGGIAVAIAGELGLPVWFAGTGEKVEDLSEFDPSGFADTLLPSTIAS